MTNAALKFLERRGEDLEPLYERFDWPLHYLRDASSWLEAERLEYVLATLEELFGPRVRSETGQSLCEALGHASPQLRAWGALDSVLRIVPGTRELYHQPDRFLASFISPQPVIRALRHSSTEAVERAEFVVDFPDTRMPCATTYLRSALEALPEFIGKQRSHVAWFNGNVLIEWAEHQVPFAPMSNMSPHESPSLSPELMRTIVADLANAQRELETTRRALSDKETELHKLKSDMSLNSAGESQNERDSRMKLALHEIYKLGDYFARAQQMVTILRGPSGPAGSARVNAEAMVRRTAWDRVSQEAPDVIRKAALLLQMDTPLVESLKPKEFPDSTANVAREIPSSSPQTSPGFKRKAPSFFDSIDDGSNSNLIRN